MNDAVGPVHARRPQDQAALARFENFSLRSDDLDEILTEACFLVGQALNTDFARVMELQDDGETLMVRAGAGWAAGVVGKVQLKATDDSAERQALRAEDTTTTSSIANEACFTYPPHLPNNGIKAVANVLISGGKNRVPFGILQIDGRELRQFTGDDTTLLRCYAALLATAAGRLRVIGKMHTGRGGCSGW